MDTDHVYVAWAISIVLHLALLAGGAQDDKDLEPKPSSVPPNAAGQPPSAPTDAQRTQIGPTEPTWRDVERKRAKVTLLLKRVEAASHGPHNGDF